MMTCPRTGEAVPTGFTFGTLAAFDATSLENIQVQCRACGEMHVVDNANVKAFPSEP
jgi:hypothetical protein